MVCFVQRKVGGNDTAFQLEENTYKTCCTLVKIKVSKFNPIINTTPQFYGLGTGGRNDDSGFILHLKEQGVTPFFYNIIYMC